MYVKRIVPLSLSRFVVYSGCDLIVAISAPQKAVILMGFEGDLGESRAG